MVIKTEAYVKSRKQKKCDKEAQFGSTIICWGIGDREKKTQSGFQI